MRKVIVSNLVSLDGFIAGSKGEIDWFAGTVDKDFDAYGIDLLRSVDTMLFGRVTYELMASFWPTAQAAGENPTIVHAMNNTSKIVFSRTLKKADWQNSHLVRGDIGEEVKRLKQQPGKDMVIYGSGKIVSVLAQNNLIDDYRIFVVPVALGKGIPQFHGAHRLHLKLLETRAFSAGIVLLRYVPEEE